MEGGTENDLRILEQEEEEEQAGKTGETSKKEEGRAGPAPGDGERKVNDKDEKKEDGKQVERQGLRELETALGMVGWLSCNQQERLTLSELSPRLKMTVPTMTKLRNLRVMGTRRRRKKRLRRKPKR